LDAERAKIEARRVESVSRIGIRRMLSENDGFKIYDIALGKWLDDGSRDFRGFLQREGNAFPAYGRVRPICETGVENPKCWEIVYLEANGTEVDITGNAAVAEPQSENLGNNKSTPPQPTTTIGDQSQDDEDAAENLAALPDTSPESAASAEQSLAPTITEPEETAEPLSDPVPAAAEPSSTHKVVPSRANARRGPGLDNQIITVLSKGTELALLGIENGWGDFLVTQGEQEGTRAWIALSIVAEIAPQ
jgi:hypothetical protein